MQETQSRVIGSYATPNLYPLKALSPRLPTQSLEVQLGHMLTYFESLQLHSQLGESLLQRSSGCRVCGCHLLALVLLHTLPTTHLPHFKLTGIAQRLGI
jgi:hypothetical protein